MHSMYCIYAKFQNVIASLCQSSVAAGINMPTEMSKWLIIFIIYIVGLLLYE